MSWKQRKVKGLKSSETTNLEREAATEPTPQPLNTIMEELRPEGREEHSMSQSFRG